VWSFIIHQFFYGSALGKAAADMILTCLVQRPLNGGTHTTSGVPSVIKRYVKKIDKIKNFYEFMAIFLTVTLSQNKLQIPLL